jgi:cysteine-rich repeat protein
MNSAICALALAGCSEPEDASTGLTGASTTDVGSSTTDIGSSTTAVTSGTTGGETTTAGSDATSASATTAEPTGGVTTTDASTTDVSTTGSSSTGADLCGNSVVDANEACDDGVNDGAYGGCAVDCSALGPFCGNTVVDGPEACDDGNQVDDDECTNACALASCGDGIKQPSEECDDANADDTDGCLSTCIAAKCGDGVTQAGVDECDDGNADDTDGCLSTCKLATCGDAKVQAGVEVCDDGKNDGAYGGCAKDCKALAPYCGDKLKNGTEVCDDGVNDGSYGGCAKDCKALGPGCGDKIKNGPETCDDGNADNTDGCLATCALPKTCLVIKQAIPAATDGEYLVTPDGITPFKAYCDMTTNGGGYSFLKRSIAVSNAVQAEAECDKFGMNLLITRTPEHVVSSYKVATNALIPPGANANYMYIMGIYPKVKGATCVSKAFNSATAMCNWRAGDDGPWYVGNKVNITEPNGDNDINASMYYTFDAQGVVTGYNDIVFPGYTSATFMCDFGDKKM